MRESERDRERQREGERERERERERCPEFLSYHRYHDMACQCSMSCGITIDWLLVILWSWRY